MTYKVQVVVSGVTTILELTRLDRIFQACDNVANFYCAAKNVYTTVCILLVKVHEIYESIWTRWKCIGLPS